MAEKEQDAGREKERTHQELGNFIKVLFKAGGLQLASSGPSVEGLVEAIGKPERKGRAATDQRPQHKTQTHERHRAHSRRANKKKTSSGSGCPSRARRENTERKKKQKHQTEQGNKASDKNKYGVLRERFGTPPYCDQTIFLSLFFLLR